MVQCINCRHFSLRDPRIALGGAELVRTAKAMHALGMGNCAKYAVSTFLSPTYARECEWHQPVAVSDMPAREAWLSKTT